MKAKNIGLILFGDCGTGKSFYSGCIANEIIRRYENSDEKSFDWCFDGEPRHSTVAVSSVGTQNNKDTNQAFMIGYNEMMKRLQPEKIIFYGKVPKECYWNIYNIQSFQSKFNVEKTILR